MQPVICRSRDHDITVSLAISGVVSIAEDVNVGLFG